MERSKLQGILVGLGAGIVQEKAVVGIAGGFAELVCKLLLQRILNAVGVESYAVELVLKCFHITRMAVSHGDDGMAAVEVQVFLSLVVPDVASTSLLYCYVE